MFREASGPESISDKQSAVSPIDGLINLTRFTKLSERVVPIIRRTLCLWSIQTVLRITTVAVLPDPRGATILNPAFSNIVIVPEYR